MPNTNQFLPFGTASGANVLSNTAWAALAARLTGFQTGVALSQQVNKPIRQATSMTAMLGAFIAAYGGDALDNGNLETLQENFEAALAYIVSQNLPEEQDLSGYLLKSGGTMTGRLLAPAGLQTSAMLLSASTNLSIADSGKLIEVTASSTVNVNLPTPIGNDGISYVVWNNSVAPHNLRTTVAGVFQGPGASGATTMTLPAGAVFTVFSDAFNWILSATNVIPQAETIVAPRLSWILSSRTWTPQDGSSFALVVCTGGGGGGGDGASGSGRGGGGGGGGETTIALVNLASVSSVLVSIGAGGAHSNGATAGGDGGTTSFGNLVSAVGGSGGSAGTSAGHFGSGGAGGVNTAGAGAVHLAGGPGSQSSDESGGSGGGGLFGNGGGLSSGYDSANAQNGFRGGGGGGGHGPSASNGGNGGNGCCLIVEW